MARPMPLATVRTKVFDRTEHGGGKHNLIIDVMRKATILSYEISDKSVFNN
jgi:hypothetical protein